MFRLRACYQNAVKDEEQFLASVAVYWEEVMKHDDRAIKMAFRQAWKAHAAFMPSLGQLVELIDAASKTNVVPVERRIEDSSFTNHEESVKHIREIVRNLGRDMDMEDITGSDLPELPETMPPMFTDGGE